MSNYSYNMTAFPNAVANNTRLRNEVAAALPTPPLVGSCHRLMAYTGLAFDDYLFEFGSATLTGPEKTTLDGVVAAHSGLAPNEFSLVVVANTWTTLRTRALAVGESTAFNGFVSITGTVDGAGVNARSFVLAAFAARIGAAAAVTDGAPAFTCPRRQTLNGATLRLRLVTSGNDVSLQMRLTKAAAITVALNIAGESP